MSPKLRLDSSALAAADHVCLQGCAGGEFSPDDVLPTLYRAAEGDTRLRFARWGMPSTGKSVRARAVRRAYRDRREFTGEEFEELALLEPDKGVAFVDASASVWRPHLEPRGRCVIPFTSFGNGISGVGKAGAAIGLPGDRANLGFLAAIHEQNWRGVRSNGGPLETLDLCGLVAVERIVESDLGRKPFSPIVLSDREAVEIWLSAPWKVAKTLRRGLTPA